MKLAHVIMFVSLMAGSWPAYGAEKANTQAETPPAEVDRIEVTGITIFGQKEIEESLEISPGDRFDRVRILRTQESLRSVYRSHGYEQASVKSRAFRRKDEDGQLETVLEFIVTEGLPTRVASIRAVPDSVQEEVLKHYWKAIELELASRFTLSVGDVYDQDKVATSKRAIQDTLASEEFVGARVEEINVAVASPPSGASESAARWVALEFHVGLGDRVSFGFRGNTVFTQGHLSSLIDEQRQLGLGKDYVNAIRLRLEEEYKSAGYGQVQISSYTSEFPKRQERHVTYDIKEGTRVLLKEVVFEGNLVFSSEELLNQFFSRSSLLTQHGYYVEKDAQKAAELLVEWIKSKGYLSAKLTTVNPMDAVLAKRAGRKTAAVRLVIYLYEGDQSLVRKVNFVGLSAFDPAEVKGYLGIQEGEPLNLFAFSEGLEVLKSAYRAKGYLGVRISNEGTESVVQYYDENRYADIQLDISEGNRYRAGTIHVEGLSQTKEVVVRREIVFKEGEILSETAVTETETRLRRLGIFSVVTLRLIDDPSRPDYKNVRISIQEGTPGVIAGGPGFRNDLGARIFGQLAYTNLWGLNHTLALTTNVNHRLVNFHFAEYQSQLSYLYPWFLLNELTFRPSVTISGTQYIQFDATTVTAAASWEKRLARYPNITGLFTYSLERVHQFSAAADVDNQDLRIGAIIPAIRIDTRDNPLSPTRGWFGTLSFEWADPAFFSQTDPYPVGYTRVQGRIDHIVRIAREVNLFLSYRGGFERSSQPKIPGNDASGAIPLIKQFALGGASSLRGFAEQQLNVQNLSITGSASYSNYRTQLDLPFAGALRLGLFFDAANLLVDNHSIGQFFFDSLRSGAGLGFHYQTPVGPVNLDFGFNLAPRPGEDTSRFYFSIGLI